MCNGRRHVHSMPSLGKRKISSAKVQLYYSVIIRIYLTSVPDMPDRLKQLNLPTLT